MDNSNDLNYIGGGKIAKLILFSPLMGGILSSIIFCSYLFYTLIKEGVYERLGIGGFSTEFFKIMPLMILISFAISYAVGLFLLIPTYFMKKKYELSDNIFWLINTLVGTVLGVFIGYQYSEVNSVLVFVVFLSIFSCSLFNASLFTASVNMIVKNNKRIEKLKEEQENNFAPDVVDK